MTLDLNRIPAHIAIIMDGNGRWAQAQGQPRTFGHREGVEAVRRTVSEASLMGVSFLTVFGFSTENWARPQQEVGFLMGLLESYFGSRLKELNENGVRVRVVGDASAFEPRIQTLLRKTEQETRDNQGLQLIVALNYGGRAEIVRAAKRALAAGIAPEALDEASLEAHLDAADVPSPDLVIRTGGELRVSNFLLWQLAYAELYFSPVKWPDFDGEELRKAVQSYQSRDRRFGGLNEPSALEVE